jgi:hypothetical protein
VEGEGVGIKRKSGMRRLLVVHTIASDLQANNIVRGGIEEKTEQSNDPDCLNPNPKRQPHGTYA